MGMQIFVSKYMKQKTAKTKRRNRQIFNYEWRNQHSSLLSIELLDRKSRKLYKKQTPPSNT